jgi:TPR repeat protein
MDLQLSNEPAPMASPQELDEAERLVRRGRFDAAAAVLRPFADAGDARAAAVMGDIHGNAKYAGADPGRTRAYYAVAAEGGVALAQHNLGWLLVDNGELPAALGWWEKSSAAGVSESSLALYGYHRRRSSMAEAMPYLERAVAQGNPFAVNTLAQKQMRGEFGLAAIPVGFVRWVGNMPRLRRYIRAHASDLGVK